MKKLKKEDYGQMLRDMDIEKGDVTMEIIGILLRIKSQEMRTIILPTQI